MNLPAGYEHPEIGEVVTDEFIVLGVANGGLWRSVNKNVIGKLVYCFRDPKEWARPKNKHWNPRYSNVKRPDGFRFLDEGEVIKKGDYCINGAGVCALPSVAMVIGAKTRLTYSPILRPTNKIVQPKPKKKTALQLANEKVAALTKELEDLKVKIRAGVELVIYCGALIIESSN